MLFAPINQSLLRGPRPILILAILTIAIYIFHPFSPTPNKALPPANHPHPKRPSKDVLHDHKAEKEAKEQESLSEQFFHFVGGFHKPKPARPAVSPAAEEPQSTHAPLAIQDVLEDDEICNEWTDSASHVLVVVRTEAANIYSQLASRLLTNLRCVPLVLFSTIRHDIGEHTIYDALAGVSEQMRTTQHEFELYEKLQTAEQSFQDFSAMREDVNHNLDKWALVPSLVAAHDMYPDKQWFVYIEAGTYLSVPNLLLWLRQMDPNQPFYAGAPVSAEAQDVGDPKSGFVISKKAASELARLYPDRHESWENLTSTEQSGNKVLAAAFNEVEIKMHPSFPNLQSETPLSVAWNGENWCKAPVTWHGMSPPLMDLLYAIERNWTRTQTPEENVALAVPTADSRTSTSTPTNPEDTSNPPPENPVTTPPLLYKDIFANVLLPLFRASPNRTAWDNLSSAHTYTDKTRGSSYAHQSIDTCRAACDIRAKCVQYVHEPNKCRLGTGVQLGAPVDEGKRMKSGWLLHRVEKWAAEGGECVAELAEGGGGAFVKVEMASGDVPAPESGVETEGVHEGEGNVEGEEKQEGGEA